MKKTFFSLFFLAVLQNVQAQNAGIGTNTPSEKLHVAGNIKADTVKFNRLKLPTGAGAGKVLTSDAAGNSSWQAAANASSNNNGNIGYGVWGDCQTNATISEYQPVEEDPFDPAETFGFAVAVSGSYAIVGSPYSAFGGFYRQGSVSIFQHDGTQWVFLQKLVDVNGVSGDQFGYSVSITDNYAFVGAPYDNVGANTDQGTVSVYKLEGGSWVFMQQIVDGTGAAGDQFGISVSASGTSLIVGADKDDVGANADQGSASVYTLSGATWVLSNKLTAAAGASSDNFGYSVGISDNYAVVGAPLGDKGASLNVGSAEVYQKVGANWTFLVSLTRSFGAAGDRFGNSVAISGLTLIVGAPYQQIGSNYSRGSASIFGYDGINWVLQKSLVQSEGDGSEYFGWSVAISGDYALVGCKGDDIAGDYSAGSATLYLKLGPFWGQHQFITDPRGRVNMTFGSSVTIDGSTKRFCVGSGENQFAVVPDNSNKVFFGKVY